MRALERPSGPRLPRHALVESRPRADPRRRLALLAAALPVLPLLAPVAFGAPGADGAVVPAAPSPPPGAASPGGRGESIPDIDAIVENLDRRAPVTAVAFSPDGARLASAAEDHQVRVWDLATRRQLRRLSGHSSTVNAVAFSPDGAILASASNDRTVRLWDASTGQPLHVLQGHVYHVYALAFDPSGRLLATASWDRTVQLWDPGSGRLLRKLKGHAGPVRSVDFSPDGKLLASASDDRTIRLWSVEHGTQLRAFEEPAAPMSAVRFRPDGKWLFSGSTGRGVRSWRLPDGAVTRAIADCRAPVRSLTISPSGQVVAAACDTAGAFLWDAQTSAELRRFGGDAVATRAIAFSPDGRLVAAGTEDGSIAVRDVAAGRPVAVLSADLAHLDAVAWSPDGALLATAARDGHVLVWHGEAGHRVLGQALLDEPGAPRALAFSPSGSSLATGADNGKLVLWELGEDRRARPARHLVAHDGAVHAVAFVDGGAAIASAGEDATVRLWKPEQDGSPRVLKGHAGPVRALAVSPDGTLLASASDDQTVRLWNVASGRNTGVLRSHRAPVTAVAFTPDGKHLVTGARDQTLDVWLVAKGRLLRSLRKELPSGVVALAVARGGRIVAATSDGVLGLWELAGPRPLAGSTAPAGTPSALALGPDGTLASASRDGVLRLWDSQTLERRFLLAGAKPRRWFACRDGGGCWREETGTLLGRWSESGEIVPVPPTGADQHTVLVATADVGPLAPDVHLKEGGTVSIPVRIENRGAHPAYFVTVAQSAKRGAGGRASLVLIPPAVIPQLAPATSTTVSCEVSALGDYEDPRPHRETLRLSITSASARGVSLAIPVEVEPPHLELRGLILDRGGGRAVRASLTGVSMAALEPVVLQGALTVPGGDSSAIPPITIEQALAGQDLTLSFPLPDGIPVDRRTRLTLTVRKGTHPAHVWTFAEMPVHVPSPPWAWALLVAGLLGLGLAAWRAQLHLRGRSVLRAIRRSARSTLTFLAGVGRALKALVFLPSTLRSLRARLRRHGIAVTFFRLEPETQCSHLARQLGATWRPLADDHQPVFELQLGPDVPLDLERCVLALPADATALAATLDRLGATREGQGDDGEDEVAVVLADEVAADVTERVRRQRPLVVCSKAAMNRVLRAPRPALAFAKVVSGQIDRARVSLYRSAAAGGARQPFYGRKAELRRLAAEPGRNHLLIGPQGIGKTSLLDQVHRRLATQPGITCHYLSLADGSLVSALGDALGLPGEPSLDILLAELAPPGGETRAVVLCDDADAWAAKQAARGGAELESLAHLAEDSRCSFILAGFLGLLHAARPQPGRPSLGTVVRLEPLDHEACAELATEPMAALSLRYASTSLVELVVRESGGMPSLLAILCDQMVGFLPPDSRTLDRPTVERALRSEAVARAITAWRPRFGLAEPRFAALDQAVMLSAVFKPRFTLGELEATLASLGVEATATEVRHAANRLVAACVFEHWLGHFHFRVPLFQSVMQEAALARMISVA